MLALSLLASSSCDETTVIGSTCEGQACPELPDCVASVQQYPYSCDKASRMCLGVEVSPDNILCESCYNMLDRLNVDSPLGPCACTYCGVQLTACFASAETEEDGDPDRDDVCQAIVQCAWFHGCVGSDCYCGAGVGREECLKNDAEGRPQGPCASLIRDAFVCEPNEARASCLLRNQVRSEMVIWRASEVAKCVSGDPLLQGEQIVADGPLLHGEVVTPMCR